MGKASSSDTLNASSKRRLDELDFLKCILILLMVSFHLVYIETLYPYAKQVVYTFHMPGFLIISGYLMRVDKTGKEFTRSMCRLVVPYLTMESAYTLTASLLPIREHIDHLTPELFLDKLLLHPLGPYWYLRSLFICSLTYYAISLIPRLKSALRFVLMGLVFGFMAHFSVFPLWHAGYFLLGVIICKSKTPFNHCFPTTWLSAILLVWLAMYPENLHPSKLGGVLIVMLALGVGLWLYPTRQSRLRDAMLYIGRNTLPIYIYSPIFTLLCKGLVPFLRFDPTGLLFLVVSLSICVAGGLAIDRALGWATGKLKLNFCR